MIFSLIYLLVISYKYNFISGLVILCNLQLAGVDNATLIYEV